MQLLTIGKGIGLTGQRVDEIYNEIAVF